MKLRLCFHDGIGQYALYVAKEARQLGEVVSASKKLRM